MSKTVYKSKTGSWMILLITIVFALLLYFVILDRSWGLFSLCLLGAVVIYYVFHNTVYLIGDGELKIKSGILFYEVIDISSITEIEAKRKHLLTGPGFSVHRLIIRYNDDDVVIISPSRADQFINDLKAINRDIVVE